MEALLLTLDIALMVWLSWRMLKCAKNPGKSSMGLFAYRDALPPKADRKSPR